MTEKWHLAERTGKFVRADDEIAALAHRSSLSPLVPLIFAPVAFTSQTFADAATYGGFVGLWFVVGLIGFGLLFLGFLVADRVIVNMRAWKVLVFFGFIGLLRSLTVGQLAYFYGLADIVDYPYRVTAGLTLTPAILTAIAVAVGRHAQHRELVTELEQKRATQLETERSMEARLAEASAKLADAVKTTIAPTLSALESALDNVVHDGTASSTTATLTTFIEREVRPLSHELAGTEPETSLETLVSDQQRTVRVPLPERFAPSDATKPLRAAVLAGAVAAPSGVAVLDLVPGLVLSLILILYTTILLAAMRFILKPVVLPTLVTAALVTLLHAAAGGASILLMIALGLEIPDGIFWAGVVACGLIGALLAASEIVIARRTATEDELAGIVRDLEYSVGIIRRRTVLARRRLALILHGSLQGALYSAVARLSEAHTIDEEVVGKIRADISTALHKLDSDATGEGPTRTQRAITELAGMWGARRTIQAHVEPAADLALSNDQDADHAASEVVREAVINALRHGKASLVEIDLRLVADSPGGHMVLQIEVRNDVRDGGTRWIEGSAGGLGSAHYDELCLRWSFEGLETGTIFRGHVALAMAPALRA